MRSSLRNLYGETVQGEADVVRLGSVTNIVVKVETLLLKNVEFYLDDDSIVHADHMWIKDPDIIAAYKEDKFQGICFEGYLAPYQKARDGWDLNLQISNWGTWEDIDNASND